MKHCWVRELADSFQGCAHGPALQPCSCFQPMERHGNYVSNCRAHQKSCCSQNKPPQMLQNAVKMQLFFYPNIINTMPAFYNEKYIANVFLLYCSNFYYFSSGPSRVTRAMESQTMCPNLESCSPHPWNGALYSNQPGWTIRTQTHYLRIIEGISQPRNNMHCLYNVMKCSQFF